MAGSVFDSALYGDLFDSGEAGRLFTDSAEIRAMLLVEGMLAQVQGEAGLIPAESAAAIKRATLEIQLDPSALRAPTGQNGVPVPGLIAAFRSEMQAPEHAQYVHWGATSQDICDTGLMLRLRQAVTLINADLHTILQALATLADHHKDTPMPARTFGQIATPTSFGTVVASWGHPLLGLIEEVPALKKTCLLVSLSGAAGTASQLGPDPAALRRALADALSLGDPGRSWHTDRTPVLKLCGWMNRVASCLGRIGEDLTQLSQTGIGEVSVKGAGSSSTMPQKQNPIGPAILTALARHSTGLNGVLQSAAMPRSQRDGAAWFSEWLCLPQIVLSCAASAAKARVVTANITANIEQMRHALDQGAGTVHAEALSFALTAKMPRPEAQAAVKALCAETLETGADLRDLVQRDHPDLPIETLFDPDHQMGAAPTEARGFVNAATHHLNANTTD
ncbi:MAG: class-II fumarase/aspartase family protein [Paracoccaceae bacterium]